MESTDTSKKINTQVKYRHRKILLKYSDCLYFFTSHLWEEVNINIVSKHKYFFTYYPEIQKRLRNSDCKTPSHRTQGSIKNSDTGNTVSAMHVRFGTSINATVLMVIDHCDTVIISTKDETWLHHHVRVSTWGPVFTAFLFGYSVFGLLIFKALQ